MKKYTKRDQKSLALWAARCAQRVLPMFQMVCPNDSRPKKAIETCLNWVHTGEFSMAEIRDASLSAHAAARAAGKQSPAAYAARAAGKGPDY